MKVNSSRSSFSSPKKEGSKFPLAERNLALGVNQFPKVGPGSYFKNSKFILSPLGSLQGVNLYKTAKNMSAYTTNRSSGGMSFHNRNNTESVRRRNMTQYTNKLRKGRKKVNSISANFEDSDSSIEDGGDPGPGSYYNPETISTFKSKQESTPFQYFGASSPRFVQAVENQNPGPGSYKKVEIPRKENDSTAIFKNDRKIETIFEKYISPAPGPGKYNNSTSDFLSKKHFKDRKGNHFLTAEKRFTNNSEVVQNPGPGKYFDKKDPLAINGPRSKFDSNFGSKSKRKIESYLIQNENSPMYNLQDHNSLGKKKVSDIL